MGIDVNTVPSTYLPRGTYLKPTEQQGLSAAADVPGHLEGKLRQKASQVAPSLDTNPNPGLIRKERPLADIY